MLVPFCNNKRARASSIPSGGGAIPPEPFKTRSFEAAIGGLCLLFGLLLLLVVTLNARGRDKYGSPDAFGQRVRVREVTGRFRLTYSASTFCPSKSDHLQFPRRHSRLLFKVVWGFLVTWLTLTGIYLVYAGAIEDIEVFRERQHLIAGSCVGGACIFCATWMLVVRKDALTDEQRAELTQAEEIARENSDDSSESMVAYESMKRVEDAHATWLNVAAFVNGVACLLSVVAVCTLQAYTLPGPQLATRILTAPGYGLFCGWMLYATIVGIGMTSARSSYGPEGTRQIFGESSRMYAGSWSIAVAAVLAASIAAFVPDPTVPLPMLLVVLLFTPHYFQNLLAGGICFLGVLVAAGRTVDCMRDDPYMCER